jgi:hypothetical protein
MDPLTRLYGALAGLVFVLLTFFAGYGWRWHGEGEREAKRVAIEQQLAAEDKRLHNLAADKREGGTVAATRKTQQNFRAINTERTVIETREIYRNVCIDDDGLRLWNDANQGVGHVGVQPPLVDTTRPGSDPPAVR